MAATIKNKDNTLVNFPEVPHKQLLMNEHVNALGIFYWIFHE